MRIEVKVSGRTIVTKVASRFSVLQVSPSTRRNVIDAMYIMRLSVQQSPLLHYNRTEARDSSEFLCNIRGIRVCDVTHLGVLPMYE